MDHADVSDADPPVAKVRIGFLGAGRMGSPMALNLARNNFDVLLYDPFAAHTKDLDCEGLTRASTVDGLSSTDITISMLPDGPVTYEALCGADAVLTATIKKPHTHIAMGTLGSTWAKRIAVECAGKRIAFADAAVSGSVAMAETGQLSCMVGATPSTFALIQPVLSAMTRTQIHVGAVGSGSTMKLAVQALLAAVNQGIVECLTIAERGGIALPLAYDVLSASAGASTYSSYKRHAFIEPDTNPVAATVALFAKDVSLVQEEAAALGVETPVADAAANVLTQAIQAGLGEHDLASIITLFTRTRNQSGSRPTEIR